MPMQAINKLENYVNKFGGFIRENEEFQLTYKFSKNIHFMGYSVQAADDHVSPENWVIFVDEVENEFSEEICVYR